MAGIYKQWNMTGMIEVIHVNHSDPFSNDRIYGTKDPWLVGGFPGT